MERPEPEPLVPHARLRACLQHPSPVQYLAIKPAGRSGAVINMIEKTRQWVWPRKRQVTEPAPRRKQKALAHPPARQPAIPCWSKSPCPSYPVQAESGTSISRASMRAHQSPRVTQPGYPHFPPENIPIADRKGSGPKSGKAFLTPPPVSTTRRSSE